MRVGLFWDVDVCGKVVVGVDGGDKFAVGQVRSRAKNGIAYTNRVERNRAVVRIVNMHNEMTNTFNHRL